MLTTIISISIGAASGALMRFWVGFLLNPLFPSIPLGTLCVNVVGGFLIGIIMALTRNHAFLPDAVKLALVTGFLGSFTTFSTFAAETVTLITYKEYLLTALIIIGHVAGSIFATILGVYTGKLLTH